MIAGEFAYNPDPLIAEQFGNPRCPIGGEKPLLMTSGKICDRPPFRLRPHHHLLETLLTHVEEHLVDFSRLRAAQPRHDGCRNAHRNEIRLRDLADRIDACLADSTLHGGVGWRDAEEEALDAFAGEFEVEHPGEHVRASLGCAVSSPALHWRGRCPSTGIDDDPLALPQQW